jgi:sec-independent protein translocase protein TatC
MPDLKDYMSLTLKLLAFFGFIFEVPLAAYYLSRAGIIDYRLLSSKRRYVVLAIFIVSAIIATNGAIGSILVALPLWGFYEMSILMVKFFGKKEVLNEGL